jgi:hypothetical protein
MVVDALQFFLRKDDDNMPSKSLLSLLIGGVLSLLLLVPAHAAGGARTVSPNIPLDSYIYIYLAKLDGLGYLRDMLPDTKPYTRMRAAQWVRQMLEHAAAVSVPDYAQTMLDRLRREFERELTALERDEPASGIYHAAVTAEAVCYDGPTLTQHRTSSTYQPLNINNNGYRLAEDGNGILTFHAEGTVNDRLAFGLTPRFSYDGQEDGSADLTSGYIQTRLGNLGIQLGKDAMWWGPGERGSLPLTNNAAPRTALKLSNLEPIEFQGWLRFLGRMDGTFFYSELGERQDVPNPSFVGFRATVNPWSNFTLGASLNSIVGGEGHQLSGSDYLDFLIGKNADSSAEERWDSIAGFDFRWRIPRLHGVQLYGQLYGEDQAGMFPPLPCRNAYLLGVALPRLTADGRWDMVLEKGWTSESWYQHWLYTDGYTYKGDILGDAMGYNADRCYLKLSRYLSDGSRLAFNFETLTMDVDAASPQKVDSFWLSYQRRLGPDLTFSLTAGTADVANYNYEADRTARNYLFGVGMEKRF